MHLAEELIRHLSEAKLDEILKTFKPETVNSKVALAAVEASKSLATFYARQYKMHEEIVEMIEDFRSERRDMVAISTPRPSIIFALAQDKVVTLPGRLAERYKQISAKDFQWKEYVMDPAVKSDEIQQARFEISALAVAGLVVVAPPRFAVASFAADDATVVQRLAVLQLMDPTADLADLADYIPQTCVSCVYAWSSGHSEALAKLLGRFAKEEVEAAEVESCRDPFDDASLGSQIDARAAQRRIEEVMGVDGEGQQPLKKRKVNKDDFDLDTGCVNRFIEQVMQVFKAALLADRKSCPAYEFTGRFASSLEIEADRQESIAVSFKLLAATRLAKISSRGGTATLMRPPEDDEVSRQAGRFSELLGIDKVKVEAKLKSRQADTAYDRGAADEWFTFLAPLVRAAMAAAAADPPPPVPRDAALVQAEGAVPALGAADADLNLLAAEVVAGQGAEVQAESVA